MKKRKRNKCLLKDHASLTEKLLQKGHRYHCGKALLLAASYQVFSVFFGSTAVQATPTGPDQKHALRDGAPVQDSSLSLDPADRGNVPIYLACIGCTHGPDNVPGVCVLGTGGSTGSSGRSSRTSDTSRIDEEYQRKLESSNRCNKLLQQGTDLFNSGRYQEALDLYLEAKRIYPEGWTNECQQSVISARSMIYVTDADAAMKQGDFEQAADLLRQAMSINPKEASLWKSKLDVCDSISYTKKGLALIDQGNYAEAEAAYRQAIKLDQYSHSAYRNLGNMLRDQKRYSEAEAAYSQAIKLNPYSSSAYHGLGNMLKEQKRYTEAEAAYRQAIELNPNDFTAQYNLGNVLTEQERYTEAEAAYRQVLTNNPNDIEAYSALGHSLENQKRYTEAEAAYQEVLSISPDNKNAQASLQSLITIQQAQANREITAQGLGRETPEGRITGRNEDASGAARQVFDNSVHVKSSVANPAVDLRNAGKAPEWPGFVTNDKEIIRMQKDRDGFLAIQQKKDAELTQIRKQIEAEVDSAKKGDLMVNAAQIKAESSQAEYQAALNDKDIKKRAKLLIDLSVKKTPPAPGKQETPASDAAKTGQ